MSSESLIPSHEASGGWGQSREQRRQRVCVLGSTGSIGVNTLDVLARHPDRYEVVALSGNQRLDVLMGQLLQWRPRFVALPDAERAKDLRGLCREQGLSTEVIDGADALSLLAGHEDVDVVMAAIVGAAGLQPALAAARAGKRLLLANKEAIVLGGELFMRTVREGACTLLPIDSEHSAIFQCLPADRRQWISVIDHIILTASGGPFRDRDPHTLADVTPQQACAHPNWSMGRKISVDSATMMNKALEVIEARWLFDLQPRQIKVLIHPQSIVHSMVVCRDQSVMAQLGTPDMRVPIAYGLSFPERIESGARAPVFTELGSLTFREADAPRYPGLALAWEALEGEPGMTAVLNAANEIAVEAFLSERIRFDQIHRVNRGTMDGVKPQAQEADSVEGLLGLDARARHQARELVRSLSR